MNYNKKTVLDVDVSGKKVLLRCDFNVPQDKETGEITSDKRIVAALPTIRYLLDHGAAVIACSHLGKPEPKFDKWVKKQTEKGKDPATLTEEKWKKSLDKLTLAPVAKRLSELLGKDVIFAHDVVGEDARAKAAALKGGEIMLLENTRFEPGETKNDPELARALASMAELYVSDAFGTVHRAHASTAGVAEFCSHPLVLFNFSQRTLHRLVPQEEKVEVLMAGNSLLMSRTLLETDPETVGFSNYLDDLYFKNPALTSVPLDPPVRLVMGYLETAPELTTPAIRDFLRLLESEVPHP